MLRSLRDNDIDLCAGIRLVDSEDAHRVIGIARASTRWGGGVRYNDVRVVLTASTFVYARMALVMRVLGEDLVLIRTYREPTNVGPRTPARKRLDELLGTILEFVPPSYREAWLIVPAASVVDVWKVEDDVRNFCTPADLPRACVMLASGFDGRHALSAGKYHVRRPADLGRFTHYMTSILHDEYTFHGLSVGGRSMFLGMHGSKDASPSEFTPAGSRAPAMPTRSAHPRSPTEMARSTPNSTSSASTTGGTYVTSSTAKSTPCTTPAK